MLTRFREQPLKFTLSPEDVAFDKNVTVTWAIPKDQATHMDWIGKGWIPQEVSLTLSF